MLKCHDCDNGKKKEKQKTVFITGVSGQVGSWLAEHLIEKGYKVVGLRRRTSNLASPRIEHLHNNPNFVTEWGNMTDSYSLARIIKKYKPELIFNCAAQSHVRVSFDCPEETLEVNAMGTLKLLNVMKEFIPKSRLVNMSTSEQYGTNVKVPQNEDTLMHPASPYGVSKLSAHCMVKNYRESYNLFASNAIYFNNESERRGETFVTRKITLAAARIKLGLQKELYLGNLDAKRDWGYSPEYAECLLKIALHDKPDDFCIATGESHTVREFLEEVFALAKLNPYDYVTYDDRLLRPTEVPYLLGDASKAKRELGFEPKIKFKDLCRIMFESDLKLIARENGIKL